MSNVHEEQHKFVIISRSVLLRMRHISDKFVENQSTVFRKTCLYEIMWKNIAEQDRPQMTIGHMVIERWMAKPTDTHTHNM